MQPTWKDERFGVELYLADCLEVLPHLPKVDAVVTDPPYGLGEKMQGGTWGSARKYAEMRAWDCSAPQGTIDQLIELRCAVVIWGGELL